MNFVKFTVIDIVTFTYEAQVVLVPITVNMSESKISNNNDDNDSQVILKCNQIEHSHLANQFVLFYYKYSNKHIFTQLSYNIR